MWSFFHKLGSPRWFYQISGRWLPWLALLTVALLAIGIIWGLAFAPQDAKQGNSFRIIYIHVPASVVAMAGYMVMAGAGAVLLIWRMKLAEIVLQCAAPIGAALTFLALVTGAIWGKPTWGTWWVWDARITSVVVLLFLYMGVIALFASFDNREAAARACAVLSVVGLVNLPIIYWSVEWWYSLHQPATIKFIGESTMHSSMLHPLFFCLAGFYCFYVVSLLLYVRNEILYRERRTKWVGELLGESRAV